MRISFMRSGGFAGIRLTTEFDVSTLAPEEADQLQRLITTADFFQLPEQITSAKPQPDRFQYQLTINDNSHTHTVTTSEEAMPAQLQPLIEYLTNLARTNKQR